MLGHVSTRTLLKPPAASVGAAEPRTESMVFSQPARLHTAILVHTVLGARWVLLPLFTLLATDSMLIAWQLTGQFAAWSLAVLVANTSLSSYVAAGGGAAVRYWRRERKMLAAIPVLVLPLLTWHVLVLAPAIGEDLARAVALLSIGSLAIVFYSIWNASYAKIIARLYTVWAVAESLFGLVIGTVLAGCGTLLVDDGEGGVLSEWMALFQILIATCVLSYLSLGVEVYLLCLLWRYEFDMLQADAVRSGTRVEMECRRSEVSEEASDSSFLPDEDQLRERAEHERHGGLKVVVMMVCPLYLAILLVFTLGFFGCQVWRVGEVITGETPVPPCGGCFCNANNTHAVEEIKNIIYGEAYNRERGKTINLTLDVYRPLPNGRVQAPAIVFAHGGGFIHGNKDKSVVVPEAQYYARVGFVAFTINYRLEADVNVKLPEPSSVADAVYDLKAAVRWVVRHAKEYGIDTSRIVVWGSSAGAITAASSMLVPADGNSGNVGYPSNVSAAVGVSGCIWPFLLRPFHRVDKQHLIPWMDIHGDQDITVFPTLALITHHLLQELGVKEESNRLVWVPKGGHVPWGPWFGPHHTRSGEPEHVRTRELLRPHVQAFLVKALHLVNVPCT